MKTFEKVCTFQVEADDLESAIEVWDENGPECAAGVTLVDDGEMTESTFEEAS